MQVRHLRNDHRFMPQIVSSAIWNSPPPDKLMTLMQATNRSHKVGKHTSEKMVRLFHVGPQFCCFAAPAGPADNAVLPMLAHIQCEAL